MMSFGYVLFVVDSFTISLCSPLQVPFASTPISVFCFLVLLLLGEDDRFLSAGIFLTGRPTTRQKNSNGFIFTFPRQQIFTLKYPHQCMPTFNAWNITKFTPQKNVSKPLSLVLHKFLPQAWRSICCLKLCNKTISV